MIIGIALGVAVVVAIDTANEAANKAFELSTEVVTGKATHQIRGGPVGIDEKLYVDLKRSGVLDTATPVISEYVSSPQLDGATMQLLGIDPYSDASFRNYFNSGGSNHSGIVRSENLAEFLTQPATVLISSDIAKRFGLKPCSVDEKSCRIQIEVSGKLMTVYIVGLIEPYNAISRRALQSIILSDISTAQELTGRIGKLDWIDVILPTHCVSNENFISKTFPDCSQLLTSKMPPGITIQTVETRTGSLREMSAAFRLNLTALSLLALVVGLFLIYNTMTFSVVQRRTLFGIMRCLGVTRRELFVLIMTEATITGLIGSLIGLLLGILMGQGAVRLVSETLNDLFFVVTVRGVQLPISSLIKGGLLGIFATILTAVPPALEAGSVPPNIALVRSGLESKARKILGLSAFVGVFLILLAIGLFLLPTKDLIVSFTGTFTFVIGFALLAPFFTQILMHFFVIPTGIIWGSLGRMAPRNILSTLSRTSVAIASLMVAISVTIGVSIMVSSFRYTVIQWLAQTLTGDIYISLPSVTSTQSFFELDPLVLQRLNEFPYADNIYVLRSIDVDSPNGIIHIAATSNPQVSIERSYVRVIGPIEMLPAGMKRGGVIISEPLSNRLGNITPGSELVLYTDVGETGFPVLGIYNDYASTLGTVLMDLEVYRNYWQDNAVTAAAINVGPEVNIEEATQELQRTLSPIQRVVVRPNQLLRAEVLEVFDRTFSITRAMQLLATTVAFVGILSALLSIELERQREMGILRSLGLTIKQLWTLILLETGLIGTTAGLLALPVGYILSIILVHIINWRSFGWTLQMLVQPDPFLRAFEISIIAALLAGLYPAYRVTSMVTSQALRNE